MQHVLFCQKRTWRKYSSFSPTPQNASLSPIVKTETVDKPGRQITPGEQQMDGFYYARLVKSAD